ncbi:MAG: undecaprenyl/decaprenyl-phosphate alpha-N-acetylglucosaminyl 1-phosphate transferase [Planctomycetes bacterium]|nr:undecaprenyl/decaprenyl-phosphate alpha-N-acetylglucosaminyl 1-phosphate transferase [Planctomycetota bacterium]
MITEFTLPLLAIPVGLLIAAPATWLVRIWSIRSGFIDKPGGHKAHAAPVALGGGVAISAAVVLPILVGIFVARFLHAAPPTWLPAALVPHLGGIVARLPIALAIAGAAIVMCGLGAIDDRRPLGPGLKFLIQFAVAAGLVIFCNLRLLTHLGAPISIALSILWIVTLTNSLNFLDNMDGLAAGVAAIAASIFAISSMLAGQIFVPVCCWLLVGALLGFLPFNIHPARIYMGDAGSTVIGLLLAVFTILTTFVDPEHADRPLGVLSPLVVMAVPLYDTASVFFIRWRLGVPLWRGDRRHFSHRLVKRGMSTRKAVLVIWLATLVTAMPALFLPKAEWHEAWIIVIHTLLVVTLVALLESSGDHDKP